MIEQLDKKFIQYLTRQVSRYFYNNKQGLVTQETLGTLIPFVTKKRKKKNYQEILSEYLNHLSSSGNKLNSVSKEMKSQFFMNMNDMILNKNDELKYLILMREEFFKYKLKMYYFRKWKSRALYNHDLLEEDDPFQNNDSENYQNFKNLNYMGQGTNRNSTNNNININNNNLKNSLMDSKIGNNPNLLFFDDEQKKREIKLEDSIKVLDVQQNINNALSNANNVFSRINTKNSKDGENEQYNNILNSIERMKNNVINGENLSNKKNDINNNIYGNHDKNNYNNNNLNNFNDLLIESDNESNEKEKNLKKLNDLLIRKNKEGKLEENDLNKFNDLLKKIYKEGNLNENDLKKFNDLMKKLKKDGNLNENELKIINDLSKKLNKEKIINEIELKKINDLLVKKNKEGKLDENVLNSFNNLLKKIYNEGNLNENDLKKFNDLMKKIKKDGNLDENELRMFNDLSKKVNKEETLSENELKKINDLLIKKNREGKLDKKDINTFNDLLKKINKEDNLNENDFKKFNDLLRKIYKEGNLDENELKIFNDLSKKINNKKNQIRNRFGDKDDNNDKDNIQNKSKNKNKFDPKKLYKYPIKDNNDNDEDRYKDSKYISSKYKDYLHSGLNSMNNKSKSKSKQKNKLNDLYKEIQKNLQDDESLLRKLELKREISNKNIYGNKSRSKSKNKKENILDKLGDYNKNISKQNKLFNYDSSKNFEENLKNNGFFSGKNKKNENILKEDSQESNEDTYPDKIREIIEKYQNEDNFKLNDGNKSKGKNKMNNYDYVKKIKANEQGFHPITKFQPYNYNNNINYVIKPKREENDYDEEYEDLFHPKNNIRNNYNNINDYNQLNTSEYSNSVYNIINNIDDYDNLINGLNQPKNSRINKKRIVHHPKKEQRSYLENNIIENSISNNSTFILAPMKDVPITNISFRARMKYFSDKKKKNLEKMIKNKKEEEKQIYTFHPKTGINKLNVIKYDNYLKTENNINNNRKRLPDYDRINNLYLDYKEKKIKRDELTKEYYKKAGISFTPMINDKNKEIKEFKNKIGQIPYLDRMDIYNANKQGYNNDKCNLIPKELY